MAGDIRAELLTQDGGRFGAPLRRLSPTASVNLIAHSKRVWQTLGHAPSDLSFCFVRHADAPGAAGLGKLAVSIRAAGAIAVTRFGFRGGCF